MKGKKRPCARFPVSPIPVTVECSGKALEMAALNISRSGMLVTGPELAPVGAALSVRLNLTREITLKGVVRHMVHGCGVQFIGILPEEQAKLTSYLDRLAVAVAEPFVSEMEQAELANCRNWLR